MYPCTASPLDALLLPLRGHQQQQERSRAAEGGGKVQRGGEVQEQAQPTQLPKEDHCTLHPFLPLFYK
jgi:hypothetical protein